MDRLDTVFAVPSTTDGNGAGERPDWWQDCGTKGTWQDTYTARKRVFPDGQAEVTICRERYFLGPAITPGSRAKRGESDNRESNEEDAARRARKTVRHRCKAIGADRLVTLTYRENMTDREVALKHWKAFVRRLSRVQDFHYVAVIETQERGAIHFHVAVKGRQHYAMLRSIWYSVLGTNEDGSTRGQVNVRDPHKFGFGSKGHHKLASYIAKYCGKQMDVRDLNQKRYFCSRGIVIPEVEQWRLPGVTNMFDACLAAYDALIGHKLDGMQSWCNNSLGFVYMATGPGFVPLEECCPF